jgi:hypothetical protein
MRSSIIFIIIIGFSINDLSGQSPNSRDHNNFISSQKASEANAIKLDTQCLCRLALDSIFMTLNLHRIYYTQHRTLTSFVQQKNPKMFSTDKYRNQEILKKVVEMVKDRHSEQDLSYLCPSIVKTTNGYVFNIPPDISFLGEPLRDPCFVAYITYIIRQKSTKWDDTQLAENNKLVISSNFLTESQNSPLIKYINLFKNQCEKKESTNSPIELFDIPIFNYSRIDAVKYFAHHKYLPVIEPKKCLCKDALDIIDQQSKYWYNMISSIDGTWIAFYSDDKVHPERSYFNHQERRLKEVSYLMDYAAPILKTNGIIDKNIQIYIENCLFTNNYFKPDNYDEFIKLNSIISSSYGSRVLGNLKLSMNDMRFR